MPTKHLVIGAVVVFINLLLKSIFATEPSISGDEAFSIFYAQQELEEIFHRLMKDTNPPFYFIGLCI